MHRDLLHADYPEMEEITGNVILEHGAGASPTPGSALWNRLRRVEGTDVRAIGSTSRCLWIL